MTPTEWAETLDTIHAFWPSAKPWPREAVDQCYRRLRGFPAHTVNAAVERLVGERPPSPASLEAKVTELAANALRYAEALPESSPDRAAALEAAKRIRGELSWQEWLEHG